METSFWPLFGLRVRTPRLELRPPDDHDVEALTRLARDGVHEPGTMPFKVPWTDTPSPRREREALQYFWRCRADWSVERWQLPMAVEHEGQLVGVQDLAAANFPSRRVVATGSWLGLAHQGRGLGKEMRSAALHLAFTGLGARCAETSAFEDNPASLGVTRALGYQPNGEGVGLRRGVPSRMLRFRLTGADHTRRDDIEIDGLHPCLVLFGLAPDPEPGR